MFYLVNSFSINMLPEDGVCTFTQISLPYVMQLLEANRYISAIGHQDTAIVISKLLGVDIPANRINVVLNNNDKLIVAQYTGPRLPEGATELPEGVSIKFWHVHFRFEEKN